MVDLVRMLSHSGHGYDFFSVSVAMSVALSVDMSVAMSVAI